MGFTSFGLSGRLLDGVHAAGYTEPTRIQALAIPPAIEGKDVIGCAQTGTGKTAAFVLPILHRLNLSPRAGRPGCPRALVLTPTRELAQQVHASVEALGHSSGVRAVCVFGGASLENQVKLLRRSCDVVVATPGRLLDLLDRRSIDLTGIEILVLDEADRMLDMGFIHDVRKIIGKIPTARQTMLFSATLSNEITSLASTILRSPVTVDAGGRHNPVAAVEQRFYAATRETKMGMLLHALESPEMQSVLVFSRTKHGADKISRRLERTGIPTAAIHSNRTQTQRDRALKGFKEGKFRVLVATDIAARGIDVSGISHVINYDIPQEGESYVHRIGRTGRAGATGAAMTFVTHDDRQFVRRIEQFTGKRFMVGPYPSEIPGERSAIEGNADSSHNHRRERKVLQEAENAPLRSGKKNRIFANRRRKPAKGFGGSSTDQRGGAWSNY